MRTIEQESAMQRYLIAVEQQKKLRLSKNVSYAEYSTVEREQRDAFAGLYDAATPDAGEALCRAVLRIYPEII